MSRERPLVRIIPRLDIKGPNLVKGIHFEGLRVLGKPEQFARLYHESGADELLYVDVVASLYGRNSLLNVVERTAREIFIPLTVGGGLRTIEDIRTALRAGADKVSLNTAAVKRPEFVREAVRRFGSSTIVVSIEAMKRADGTYEAYTDNGRERTGFDAFEWAARVAELGAGELLVTSIDREGTGRGFDIELTRRIAESVPIPVLAGGGASTSEHVISVIREGRCQGVCLASMLHYGLIRKYPRHHDFEEGVTAFLESGREHSVFGGATVADIKSRLLKNGVATRPAEAATHG
jgi:cyclase